MIKIAVAHVWVHDQQEALDFYTKKLGMEVRSDVSFPEMGEFRWLTVAPPGQEDVAIVLMPIPGPPVMDTETAEQVQDSPAGRRGEGLRHVLSVRGRSRGAFRRPSMVLRATYR